MQEHIQLCAAPLNLSPIMNPNCYIFPILPRTDTLLLLQLMEEQLNLSVAMIIVLLYYKYVWRILDAAYCIYCKATFFTCDNF